ncbi:AAA family ATPase [Desulfurococcaceae archaeon MEX13E-LK6-19]|nr:AAA family ATPase [Desulfurococcaceae archaeon MEX13E-LK6-19]
MLTGSSILDEILEKHRMILVYGEAGTGKTTLLLTIARNLSINGWKILFISTEGSMYMARVAPREKDYSNVFFAEVYSLDELLKLILTIPLMKRVDGIIIDSINAPFRLEAYKEKSIEKLGIILGLLKYITLKNSTVVYSSAQVRAVESIDGEEVTASGMPILEFWFDLIIQLLRSDGERVLKIVKPLDKKDIQLKFIIEESGVEWIDYS